MARALACAAIGALGADAPAAPRPRPASRAGYSSRRALRDAKAPRHDSLDLHR